MLRSRRAKSEGEIARNMRAIKSKETATEIELRRALFALGLRYRKNVRGLVGSPDIVFRRGKVAIFIDGDFWHGRRLIEAGLPALRDQFTPAQLPYWQAKLRRNVERDRAVTAALTADGWKVIRYWESEVKLRIPYFAKRIYRRLEARRRALHTSGGAKRRPQIG